MLSPMRKTALPHIAQMLLPHKDLDKAMPRYTQGLMDLGATLCTSANYACAICPMSDICVARREGRQGELPAARPRKVLPERETSLLLLTDGEHVLLERRPPSGIWGGLLSLPEGDAATADELVRRHGLRLLAAQPMATLRHTFTHFRLNIQTVCCRVERVSGVAGEPGWEWLDLASIESAALPTPIRRLLASLD